MNKGDLPQPVTPPEKIRSSDFWLETSSVRKPYSRKTCKRSELIPPKTRSPTQQTLLMWKNRQVDFSHRIAFTKHIWIARFDVLWKMRRLIFHIPEYATGSWTRGSDRSLWGDFCCPFGGGPGMSGMFSHCRGKIFRGRSGTIRW